MRILLSNDDGVFAPGLAALREAVDGLGEASIVAPDTPQSASAHSITVAKPLTVRKVRLDAPGRWEALSVDGRPADCVRLAIRELLDAPPDLVLTGINAGSNIGVNVFYSGTVAAAAEGAMLGLPAVAFSASFTEASPLEDFRRAATLCRWVLDELLEGGLVAGDLINVNIPAISDTSQAPGGVVRGVRVVPQSTAEIEDAYVLQRSEAAGDTYKLGESYSFAPGQENTDVVSLAEGYITVTPLHVDMTNHDRLAALARRRWPTPP